MSIDNSSSNYIKYLLFGGALILLFKRKKLANYIFNNKIVKQLSISSSLDHILIKNLTKIPTENKFAIQETEKSEENTEHAYIFNYDEKTNYGIKIISDEDIGGNSIGELIFNGKNSSLKVKGKFQMIHRDLLENRIMYAGLTFDYKSNVRKYF